MFALFNIHENNLIYVKYNKFVGKQLFIYIVYYMKSQQKFIYIYIYDM